MEESLVRGRRLLTGGVPRTRRVELQLVLVTLKEEGFGAITCHPGQVLVQNYSFNGEQVGIYFSAVSL